MIPTNLLRSVALLILTLLGTTDADANDFVLKPSQGFSPDAVVISTSGGDATYPVSGDTEIPILDLIGPEQRFQQIILTPQKK